MTIKDWLDAHVALQCSHLTYLINPPSLTTLQSMRIHSMTALQLEMWRYADEHAMLCHDSRYLPGCHMAFVNFKEQGPAPIPDDDDDDFDCDCDACAIGPGCPEAKSWEMIVESNADIL